MAGNKGLKKSSGDLVTKGADPPDSHEYASVPLIDVQASAGGGAVVESQEAVDVLHFKNEWLHNELHVNPNELRLLFADGESMEPSI